MVSGESEIPQPLSALSTVSTGSSPRASRPLGLQAVRTPSFLQLSRRIAAQERINDILETGRQRAESRGNSFQRSPRMQPLLGVSPGASPNIPEQDSIADDDDETLGNGNGAGTVRRPRPSPDQGMNYQATQTSSSTRSRRSGGLSPKPSAKGQSQSPNAGRTTGSDPSAAARDGGAGRSLSHGSGAASRRSVSGDQEKQGWVRRVWANLQSIELENKGSVARDHLALERTFLAWLRTSLAFASIGIAVTQLFRLNASLQSGTPGGTNDTLKRLGKPLGGTFLAISILILFMGYNRYVQSQRWILRGKFPASRGSVLVISLVAFGLMALSLVVVIVVQPSSPGVKEAWLIKRACMGVGGRSIER